MNKVYSRINWENEPSTKTPLNEHNLNKIDFAVDEIDNRVIELDATKAKSTDLQTLSTRVDNLILNAGDSSAECTDARVTEDGTTYDTLKKRLDAEHSSVIEDISQLSNDIAISSTIIIPFEMGREHAYIDPNQNRTYDYGENANVIENNDTSGGVMCCSSFVTVSPNSSIMLYGLNNLAGDYRGYALYDENYQFVGGARYGGAVENLTIQIPDNARYLRFTYIKGNEDLTIYNLDLISSLQAFGNKFKSTFIQPVIEGQYIKGSTGECLAHGGYYASDYIDVSGYDKLYIKSTYLFKTNFPNDDYSGYTFYDKNKVRVKGVKYNSITANATQITQIIDDVPENATYLRFTSKSSECEITSYTSFNSVIKSLNILNESMDSMNQELYSVNDYCDLSLFSRFGVIGDSYSSGELYFNDEFVDKYDISWGQILARKKGTICTNYSKGGLTTRSWLSSEKGLSLLNNSVVDDIYYIMLGINDFYALGESYLGSITDITNFTTYADYNDTFYGNYGKIIEQVKAHAPNSKIVLFTMANTSTVPQLFNNAIIEIATHYNLPYIVQSEDEFFKSTIYTNMSGGHPTAIGYSGMANALERLLKQCIINNQDYFYDCFMY